MAKSQRAVQEATAHPDTTVDGEAKLIEDLLLMVRKRIGVAKRAGISRVRLEMVTTAQAEILVDVLDRLVPRTDPTDVPIGRV